MAGDDADNAEEQADGGERKGDRKAVEHEDDHAQEHGRRDNAEIKQIRFSQLALLQRLFVFHIDADMAGKGCDPLDQFGNALKGKQPETGDEDQLDGPADQPAGIARYFPLLVGKREEGPANPGEEDACGKEEDDKADNVDPDLRPVGNRAIDQIDADMLIVAQRRRGAEHDDEGEEIPLDLKPAVRTVVEGIADDGVSGADQTAEQHHIFGNFAHELADRVDQPTGGQKYRHFLPLFLSCRFSGSFPFATDVDYGL
jgi:hypothetical protein